MFSRKSVLHARKLLLQMTVTEHGGTDNDGTVFTMTL